MNSGFLAYKIGLGAHHRSDYSMDFAQSDRLGRWRVMQINF